MFDFFKKSGGLLGMNARNLDYIRPHNRKRGREIADNKLVCKRILKKNGLGVPALLAKITNTEELERFDWSTLPNSFALKPNRGFGGEGILVVYGKKKPTRPVSNIPADEMPEEAWIKADGSVIRIGDIKRHIRNILDGSFSLSNIPDIAFFEERLTLLKLFKPYAYKGIPDIRVIVFNRVPVMAMLRLPTRASDGKANLQQGAIGVGIDLATGTTTHAILGKGAAIEYVPGTRLALSGIKIPYWKDILKMSVVAQEVSGLGFLGAGRHEPLGRPAQTRHGGQGRLADAAALEGTEREVPDLRLQGMGTRPLRRLDDAGHAPGRRHRGRLGDAALPRR